MKFLRFWSKHLAWVIVLSLYLVWQFDRPVFNAMLSTVTAFVHDVFTGTTQVRQEVKEVGKDLKELKK